jgi:hypothetical protein
MRQGRCWRNSGAKRLWDLVVEGTEGLGKRRLGSTMGGRVATHAYFLQQPSVLEIGCTPRVPPGP